MARLPIYTQQTTVGAPEVSMSAAAAPFGAAAQIGGALSEIGAQMKRREDVIDRVDKLGTFDTEAIQMLEAIRTTGNIASKDSTNDFYQGLRARADELVESHSGTSTSRAELKAQLYNQVEQYHRSAIGEQIKVQHQMIATNVQQKANELALTATFAPSEITNSLAQFDDHLNSIADSMSPQQLTEYRNAGRADIASGAINGFLQRGDLKNARKMLRETQIGTMLPAKEAQKFALTISAEEGKAAAAAAGATRNINNWQSFLGRELTAQEASRARSMDPFAKNKSIPEQIVEMELITGQPVNQADIDRLFKRTADEPGFGNTLKGRALDYVTNNSEAFAAGMMDEPEARRFLAAYNEAYGPTYRKDPDTDEWVQIKPSVPQYLQDALETGSRRYGGMAPAPASTVASETASASAAPAPSDAPEAAPTQPAAPAAPAAPARAGEQSSVWQRRQNLVGPVAGTKSAVFGIPGVGPSIVDPAEGRQIEADRTFAQNASRDLIRVLQNNPRFAEGERQAIEKEVGITPEFFRSLESFEGKLIGINQSLYEREQEARDTLNSRVSGDERKRALDNINAIDQFRRKLGIPPYVSSPQEVFERGYPPGSEVMGPGGRVYIVPQR
jgi:hypothetical protein